MVNAWFVMLAGSITPAAAGRAYLGTLQVKAAGEHTCALIETGETKCWGQGSDGVLGYGDQNTRGTTPESMGEKLPAVNFGTNRTAVFLAGGEKHRCVILNNGALKCWGSGKRGMLGYGDRLTRGRYAGEMGDNLPEVDLGTDRRAVMVSCGDYHTCALLDNGMVKCWGGGNEGQLGLGEGIEELGAHPGEMGDALQPLDLGPGRTAIKVAAGDFHTCVLLDNGQVKCVGDGAQGQLGYGPAYRSVWLMGESLPSVDLGTGRTAIDITAGWFHSCALLDTREVKCWGYNGDGRLGAGDTISHGSVDNSMGDFLPSVNLGTGRYAIKVSSGASFNCALLDNSETKCWGAGRSGSLGNEGRSNIGKTPESLGDALVPVDFGGGRKAVSISAGDKHSCAVLDDGLLKCWGDNHYGQLGIGSAEGHGRDVGTMGEALPPIDVGRPPVTSTATTSTTSTTTATTSTSSTTTDTNTTTSTTSVSSTKTETTLPVTQTTATTSTGTTSTNTAPAQPTETSTTTTTTQTQTQTQTQTKTQTPTTTTATTMTIAVTTPAPTSTTLTTSTVLRLRSTAVPTVTTTSTGTTTATTTRTPTTTSVTQPVTRIRTLPSTSTGTTPTSTTPTTTTVTITTTTTVPGRAGVPDSFFMRLAPGEMELLVDRATMLQGSALAVLLPLLLVCL